METQVSQFSFIETLQIVLKEILLDAQKGENILDSSITQSHCEELLQNDRRLPVQVILQPIRNLIIQN